MQPTRDPAKQTRSKTERKTLGEAEHGQIRVDSPLLPDPLVRLRTALLVLAVGCLSGAGLIFALQGSLGTSRGGPQLLANVCCSAP